MNSEEHSLLLYFLDAVRSAPGKTHLLLQMLPEKKSNEFNNFVERFQTKITKEEILIEEQNIRKEIL